MSPRGTLVRHFSSYVAAFPAGAVAAAVVLIVCGALMLAPFRILRPKGWRLLAFIAWNFAVVAAHASRLLGS